MSRWKVVLLAVLSAPLVLFGVVAALWALLAHGDNGSRVAPNVTLAGSDVGGATASRLDATVERLASGFGDTKVRIVTPDYTIDKTADELGLSIDADATRTAALDIGSKDRGPWAPVRWAASYFGNRTAPVKVHIDRAKAYDAIVEAEGDRRVAPVEPTMTLGDSGFSLTPGTAGSQLDIDQILAAVPGSVSQVGSAITVDAEPQHTEPEITDDAAQKVVDEANTVTSHSLAMKYGDTTVDVPGADLRPAFRLERSGSTVKLGLDHDTIGKTLASRLKIPDNPTDVRFDIVNGVPTPVPGHDAVICCDEKAPDAIIAALLGNKSEVTLGTRTMTAAEGVTWANTLGVKEVVGQFTTQHPCCAPRVTNIHKMSDLTRGILIPPGTTFSANDAVGKRTAEKGFVSAPVIEEGKFSEDFGGGVSQWATTTFNAAFFAGLDIPEHKAHSIYISRYPFGREATLAFPSVDLKIRNNTPYGVVIWPTYTGTSITVQLWSTKFATGEQTAINKPSGCGSVRVTRTRTYVSDGHTDTDTFRADYNCNPPKHP